jgi:hypothetical protein
MSEIHLITNSSVKMNLDIQGGVIDLINILQFQGSFQNIHNVETC